jgi:hypothetical protein
MPAARHRRGRGSHPGRFFWHDGGVPGPTDPHERRAGEDAAPRDRAAQPRDEGRAEDDPQHGATPREPTRAEQASVAPRESSATMRADEVEDRETAAAREMERIMNADPGASGLRPAPARVVMLEPPDDADTKPDVMLPGSTPARDVIPLPRRATPAPRSPGLEVPDPTRDDPFDADAVTQPDAPDGARGQDALRPREREATPHKATRPRPMPRAERPIEPEPPAPERGASRWMGPAVIVLGVGAVAGGLWAWTRSENPRPGPASPSVSSRGEARSPSPSPSPSPRA